MKEKRPSLGESPTKHRKIAEEEEEEEEKGAIDLRKSTAGDLFAEKEEDSRKAQALKLLEEFGTKWTEAKDYSGRRMYGRKSLFAVIVSSPPQSKLGVALMKLGMHSDNMAFDYVYYFFN